MSILFNKPQRQSPIGVLIMFFDASRKFIRALFPLLAIYFLKFNEINQAYLYVSFAVVFIITAIVAYLKYINFTFFLDSIKEEFVINEGILNKTKTGIQLDKIQQVNINQSLIQKIVGVYSLEIDTAGSNKKEAKIKAISHPLALQLKERLLESNKSTVFLEEYFEPENSETKQEPILVNISSSSLLKIGLTSNYLGGLSLLLLFFFTLADYFEKFTGKDILNDSEIDQYMNEGILLQTFFIFLMFLFVLVLTINVIRTIFKYFDFKVIKQNTSLLLTFGLFNSKSTIIKPEKVQITTLTRNYFQKRMNIVTLKIKQASSEEHQIRKMGIEIPGCNQEERDAILNLIYKSYPNKGTALQPNLRKLVFSVLFYIVAPILAFVLFHVFIKPNFFYFFYFIPIYITIVGFIVYKGFKNYRLYVNEDFIIKKSGAWDIDNEIIEPIKIQAITTSQYFWHQKANIGYLTLHTAGGDLNFQMGDFTRIKEYVNKWLYQIETSKVTWM